MIEDEMKRDPISYDKWYQDLTHMPPIRELILERITGIWALK